MEYRRLGRTGMRVSGISLGTWAMGSDWGTVGGSDALAALHRAVDLGVNLRPFVRALRLSLPRRRA